MYDNETFRITGERSSSVIVQYLYICVDAIAEQSEVANLRGITSKMRTNSPTLQHFNCREHCIASNELLVRIGKCFANRKDRLVLDRTNPEISENQHLEIGKLEINDIDVILVEIAGLAGRKS